MLIELLHCHFRSWLFWQAKSREIKSIGRVCCSFWHISTWPDRPWRRSYIFQTVRATTESKSVLWLIEKLWLALNGVLGAWISIIVNTCTYTRLCAKLWSTDARPPIIICVDWVIKKKSILIMIKFWLLLW